MISEQKALSRPLIRVTFPPGIRYTLLDATAKVIETVEAVVHEQVERDALTKVKRLLHCQVADTMPAESVGVSNEITTAWPLSEN